MIIKALRKILPAKIVLVNEEPPVECRTFLQDWFNHTLLRSCYERTRSSTRSQERAQQNQRKFDMFEMFARAFPGYRGMDGFIYVYIGNRRISKAAVVKSCADAIEDLCFSTLPGVPAENKWTSMHPFLAWLVLFVGLFMLGGEAFLEGFSRSAAADENEKEEGSAEEVARIQEAKRVGRARQHFKEPLELVLSGLVLLMVCKPIDRFVLMHIRDIGPCHYLDWRSREEATGRDWRRSGSVWIADLEEQDDESFEPTLFGIYSNNMQEVRRMVSGLAKILLGVHDGQSINPELFRFLLLDRTFEY